MSRVTDLKTSALKPSERQKYVVGSYTKNSYIESKLCNGYNARPAQYIRYLDRFGTDMRHISAEHFQDLTCWVAGVVYLA
ncbi:hypothetical protein ACF0H5_022118 [Mactra antiquata]